MLECDALASCMYVNEPKVKVDLTKYTERHAFRCCWQLGRGGCWTEGGGGSWVAGCTWWG